MSQLSYDDSHVCCIIETGRWVGAYGLHLRYASAARVCVGRYNRGSAVDMGKGDYVYVGSAMGPGDGLHLPKRLIRHAMRSEGAPPHSCRDALFAHFAASGLSPDHLRSRSFKRLHWNIDYVLDHDNTDLIDVFYVRSERRLEHDLVRILETCPDAHAPFPGLGAHDHPGHSHFFRLADAARSWHNVCATFERTIAKPK